MKLFGVFYISLVWLFATVSCKCSFSVTNQSPLFASNFGTKVILFKKPNADIELQKDEHITAYCSTNVKVWDGYYKRQELNYPAKSIDIWCHEFYDTGIYFRSSENPSTPVSYNSQIFCSSASTNYLYESQKSLPDCLSNSYGIGFIASEMGEDIKIGLCYDFQNLSLSYVNYLAYQTPFEIMVANKDFNYTRFDAVTLDAKINNAHNIYTIPNKDDFNAAVAVKKEQNPILDSLQLNYANLIQSSNLKDELSGFDDILSVVWWRTLLQGNWKNFMNALSERTKRVNYMVYMGSSGVPSIPTDDCNGSEPLIFNVKGTQIRLPEYIWSYVKSINESVPEEFVVLGVNNPFQQLQLPTICKDMCKAIDWLQDNAFGRLRLTPGFGIVICCRVEDVAHKLDGFPLSVIMKSKSTSTTTTTTTPTTTSQGPSTNSPVPSILDPETVVYNL